MSELLDSETTELIELTDLNSQSEVNEDLMNLNDLAFDENYQSDQNEAIQTSSLTDMENLDLQLESTEPKKPQKPLLEIPAYNVEDEFESFYEPLDMPTTAEPNASSIIGPQTDIEMPQIFENEMFDLPDPASDQPTFENSFSAPLISDHDYCKSRAEAISDFQASKKSKNSSNQGQRYCAFTKMVKSARF